MRAPLALLGLFLTGASACTAADEAGIGTPESPIGAPAPEVEPAPGEAITVAPARRAGAAPLGPKTRTAPRMAVTQPFTLAVLPDTQFYAERYPEIFEAQTRWIAASHKAQDIQLVVHEGDIVNGPEDPAQWQRAVKNFGMLDGLVPYALARGNHDLAGGVSRVGGMMDAYFPTSKYLKYPWFRETFEAGRMENNFLLVDIKGQKWIVLTLEFGPRDAVLAWAGGILERHADVPAIVVTHAYLYADNKRYDRRNETHLHGAHEVALEGGANDGEEMWDKLISKHDNVMFVLSGHVPDDGVGALTSVRPSGSVCHQLLANYQSYAQGGEGYLRLMRFEPAQKRVVVRTYSPYLDRYKTDPDNQFTLELPE